MNPQEISITRPLKVFFELIQQLNQEQNIAFFISHSRYGACGKIITPFSYARWSFEGGGVMNTPFLLAGVINVANKKNPLVALIAKFSAIGIALGVAVLIVGLSAMNGFERELNQRILAVVPHIEIFLRIKRKIPQFIIGKI